MSLSMKRDTDNGVASVNSVQVCMNIFLLFSLSLAQPPENGTLFRDGIICTKAKFLPLYFCESCCG